MSGSPRAINRARLIREMAGELSRGARPSAMSPTNHNNLTDSTLSTTFDPENEAVSSTRHLDRNPSQCLPRLCDSARKYAPGHVRQPLTDVAIDTSAVANAFPDFTQPGLDDDSLSIEIGRGGRKGAQARVGWHQRDNSQGSTGSVKARAEAWDVLLTSSEDPLPTQSVTIDLVPRRNSVHEARAHFELENHPPHMSASAKNDAPARKSSVKQQRALFERHNVPAQSHSKAKGPARTNPSLAQMHARVAESEPSVTIDRPAIIHVKARSSRFGSARSKQPSTAPARNARKFETPNDFLHDLAHYVNKVSNPNPPEKNGTNTAGGTVPNTTQQPFTFPNMPDLSELVSALPQDASPVPTRNIKPASRFVSASGPHAGVRSIPVPGEERAIAMSIKIMEDRLDHHEYEKASLQKDIQDLKSKNATLQAQLRGRRDSAVSINDSGSDGGYGAGGGSGTLAVQKTRLESTVRSLQDRLDVTDRKVTVTKITMNNIKQERDIAVRQLASIMDENESLTKENQMLRAENERVKVQLAQLDVDRSDDAQVAADNEGLKAELDRLMEEKANEAHLWAKKKASLRNQLVQLSTERDEAMRRAADTEANLRRQIVNLTAGRKTDNQDLGKRRASMPGPVEQIVTSGHTGADEKAAASDRRHRMHERVRKLTRSDHDDVHRDAEVATQKMHKRQSDNARETRHEPVTEVAEKSGKAQNSGGKDQAIGGETTETGLLTDLSLVDANAIVRLRKRLEDERAKQKAARESAAGREHDDTVKTVESAGSSIRFAGDHHLPRNGGVEATETIGQPSEETNHVDQTAQSKAYTNDGQSSVKNSVVAKNKTRRRNAAEEMTSAFIIPDITIHAAKTDAGAAAPVLSASAQRVLDGLAGHDGHDCTVCSRVATYRNTEPCDEHPKSNAADKAADPPKPTPLAERVAKAGPYQEEPTARPSQPADVALAKVLNGLERERETAMKELAQVQQDYNQRDAATQKRLRKSLYKAIAALHHTVDTKADQIYALYDVLEAQRATGRVMSGEDLDVTLSLVEEIGARSAPVVDDDESSWEGLPL